MIKVFTINKSGKIEFTKEELQKLLDEAYYDGYNSGRGHYWTYTSPSWNNTHWTVTAASSGNQITYESKPLNDFKNEYNTIFATGMTTDKDNLSFDSVTTSAINNYEI